MDFSCLPLVVYREIFTRNFNLKTRLKLRLVCKQWRLLIDLFGQDSLAIWEQPLLPFGIKWPDSKEPIDLNTEVLNIESFKVTQVTPAFDRIDISSVFFQNLRRLCLYKIEERNGQRDKKGERRFDALANSLNQLQKLNTLYFEWSNFENITLNLANLNVLCIKRCIFSRVVLQTPNLKKFIFWGENEALNEQNWDNHNKEDNIIEFLNPESIQHVECAVLRLLGNQNFSNLNTLVCQRVVTPFDLKKFPHLKELSIYPNKEELRIVKEVKEQRDALGRRDSLSILVYGCEYLESEMPLRMIRDNFLDIDLIETNKGQYAFDLDVETFYYRLQNKEMYAELARSYPRMIGIPMPWHFVIDYPNLVDAFDGSVPANFLDKFTEIAMVIVTRQVADERKLLEFVRRSAPRRLALKNIRLHRNFYYELGTVQSIEYLILGDDLRWTKSGFLSRLRNLRGVWVEISQKFPLDFILKTYSESKSLIVFYFGKPNFGHVYIVRQPNKSKFFLSLKYSYGNNRTFAKSYYLNSLDEFSGVPELMQLCFVESQ